MKAYLTGILFILSNAIFAQAPIIENVRFEQRIDGSLLVDIYYDVSSSGGFLLDIIIEASDDHGLSWDLPCFSLDGDVGEGIEPGQGKHAVWDFYTDNPNISGDAFRVRVSATRMICGQTITEDLILTEDLNCFSGPEPGIRIGASNLTIDLGGYTIRGNYPHSRIEGILLEQLDSVTIKNGTVENFGGGIIVINSKNSLIENVTVRNLLAENQEEFNDGIVIGETSILTIKDCYFDYLPIAHKECIVIGNSNVTVDNIEVHGGSIGVNFAGEQPSSGIVKNSRFFNANMAGVYIHHSYGVEIRDNYFHQCSDGVSTDPGLPGIVSGLIIENNEMNQNYVGVKFRGVIESVIRNNNINNCFDFGIELVPNMDCPGENPTDICFYSSGNLIIENEVTGNRLDLYHQEECTGNTWEDNICITSEGSEIPSCSEPVTAGAFFPSIDSAAKVIADDAEFVFIFSYEADTTGHSPKWAYLYRSSSQQKYYELWYGGGMILNKDTISLPWAVNDELGSITGSWIDSDSVIAYVESNGGKEFREEFDVEQIEMSLLKTHTLLWGVNYICRDTVFQVSMDARQEN